MHKLLKPFDYFTNQKMFQIGLSILLVGFVLAVLFKARYDGVLDLHFVDDLKWHEPLLDIVINLFSMTFVLFVFSKLISKQTRLEDILLTTIWARLFGCFLPVFNVNNFMNQLNEGIMHSFQAGNLMPQLSTIEWGVMLFFALLAFVKLGLFVWYIWYGLSVSTNQRSFKTAVLTLISILLAEVLSKMIIYYVN